MLKSSLQSRTRRPYNITNPDSITVICDSSDQRWGITDYRLARNQERTNRNFTSQLRSLSGSIQFSPDAEPDRNRRSLGSPFIVLSKRSTRSARPQEADAPSPTVIGDPSDPRAQCCPNGPHEAHPSPVSGPGLCNRPCCRVSLLGSLPRTDRS